MGMHLENVCVETEHGVTEDLDVLIEPKPDAQSPLDPEQLLNDPNFYNWLLGKARAMCFRAGVDDYENFADDLTQETLLRAFNGLSGFRGDSQLSTWIRTIMRNTLVNLLKEKRINARVRFEDPMLHERGIDPNTPRKLATQELLQIVSDLLPFLKPRHRLAFILHIFHEYSYRKIADDIQTRPGTVKSRVHDARTRLVELLTERGIGIEEIFS